MKRAARAVALFAVCVHGPAHAADRDPDERVPLAQGFPVAERFAIAGLAVADLGLYLVQHTWLADRAPNWTRPPAFDRAVSDALYRGADAGPLWGGVPDRTGALIAPFVAGTYYVTDATLTWTRGAGFAGDPNADHELLAVMEAYGATMLLNQGVKLAVGRLRPEYALGRRPGEDPRADHDGSVSFYSMHTSLSFCLAAFVARDLGDHLTADVLLESSPAARLWLGRVLPSAALYGAASLVGVSRIVDQKHYLSDVLVGAALGGLTGNLVYAAHFDGRGRARRAAWRFGVTPLPGGFALHGRF